MFHSISRHFSVLLKINFVRNLGNKESFRQSYSNTHAYKSCDQCPPLSEGIGVWFMLISKKIWPWRHFKLSLFPSHWNYYLFLKCKIFSWFHQDYSSSIICYCRYWTLYLLCTSNYFQWHLIIPSIVTIIPINSGKLYLKKKKKRKETKSIKINLSINFEIKPHKPLRNYLMYFGTDIHGCLSNNTKIIFFLVCISKGNKISNTH